MRNILFLNTTGSILQLAISADGKIFRSVGTEGAKRHNAAILPVLDDLLTKSGVSVKNLTHIVTVSGPGSFTGIRCGASFANALARSTGAKLYAPTSLEILGEGDRIVALDCKHGNFYALIVENGEKRYAELNRDEMIERGLPIVECGEDTLDRLIAYGTETVEKDENNDGNERFCTDLIRPFYLKPSSAERLERREN